MTGIIYPDNYLLFNEEDVKNLVIVVKIDGLDTVLSNVAFNTRVRYGDPIVYGQPGLVYGGLRDYTDENGNKLYQSILDLNGSSSTITQRLEPEQGRGAVSTLSLAFIDLHQYMTRLVSPGIILDDILGKKVTIYMGYLQISYPEDYLIIFRGRISSYSSQSGRVILQISDPNMARRQEVFFSAKTVLLDNIDDTQTTIPVASVTDFHQQIMGPASAYDPGVHTYAKIDEEVIEYGPSGIDTENNQFINVIRGARDTFADNHDSGAAVEAAVQIEDHPLDMALKVMLSGYNGPWVEDIPVRAFVFTGDALLGAIDGGILLPNGVDAERDYGIAEGDYITTSGAITPQNDATVRVLEMIEANGFPNSLIITDGNFAFENASSATMSVRSQFDTYPVTCGVKLPSEEVDVSGHISLKNTFFGGSENNMRFYLNDVESCKTFCESELYLPLSCYSLTRYGRLSVKITKAPLAEQKLNILDKDNVIFPESIKPERGVNNRKFFNQVDWYYDADDDGNFARTVRTFDSESLSIIGISSILPIKSRGIHSDIVTDPVIQRRTNFLLQRYKRGAVVFDMQVNFEVGSTIEAGDVLAVRDGGVLQITNIATGIRNLGTQLLEVIDRQLDVKNGNVKLKLCAGVGSEFTDRYGTISPSSVITQGSLSAVVIDESYGEIFPFQEFRKWEDYIGLNVWIHTEDYNFSATATLTGIDQTFRHRLFIQDYQPSAFPPSAGMILDIGRYPENNDFYDQELSKVVHAFLDPQVVAATGISETEIEIAASGINIILPGLPIIVHDESWSIVSPERTVTAVDLNTNIITVDNPLGFIAASGYQIDLIGFPDGRAGYRFI